MELFGIEIKRKGKEPEKSGKTFTPPTQPDGAVEIETTETGINFAQQSAYAFDLDAMPTDEFELLLTYRQLALQQEIDEAVQEIVNESIIMDDMKASVSIVLDDVELSENIKDKIRDEFEYIMKLLKFKTEGYGEFRATGQSGAQHRHSGPNQRDLMSSLSDQCIPPSARPGECPARRRRSASGCRPCPSN